jgi:hypothetical protein
MVEIKQDNRIDINVFIITDVFRNSLSYIYIYIHEQLID